MTTTSPSAFFPRSTAYSYPSFHSQMSVLLVRTYVHVKRRRYSLCEHQIRQPAYVLCCAVIRFKVCPHSLYLSPSPLPPAKVESDIDLARMLQVMLGIAIHCEKKQGARHTSVRACVRAWVGGCLCVRACMRVCVCMHVRARVCVCVCVCMCLCVRVYSGQHLLSVPPCHTFSICPSY